MLPGRTCEVRRPHGFRPVPTPRTRRGEGAAYQPKYKYLDVSTCSEHTLLGTGACGEQKSQVVVISTLLALGSAREGGLVPACKPRSKGVITSYDSRVTSNPISPGPLPPWGAYRENPRGNHVSGEH